MTRRLSVAMLVCFVVHVAAAAAQDFPTAKPESVGMSGERLERIGKTVQKEIDDKHIAGVVTLVMRHGQVVWSKAQGMQDLEAGKRMRPDAIFRICSMSKPITSAAVMMLYEEGNFLLEDPVSKYLPEFKNPKVLVKPANGGQAYTIPATREITIRDLLSTHFGYHLPVERRSWSAIQGSECCERIVPYDGTIADSVERLSKQPLLFNPGERWEYGLSVDVLGRLVEVISGKPLDEFLRTRIFEPLGMKDTYFFPPDNKLDRLATAYTYYDGKGLIAFPTRRSSTAPSFTRPIILTVDPRNFFRAARD